MDFYIHQIGDFNNIKTYERLISILKSKMICSRGYLEKMHIDYFEDNPTFMIDDDVEDKEVLIDEGNLKIDINLDENIMRFYEEDIHKDRVSLSDPANRYVARAIKNRDHQLITCFDYNYIAFAVSKDVPIVPREETNGLALGEVQVKDKIDNEYIKGLILPLDKEQLYDEKNVKLIDKVVSICLECDFPLDIYNYDGDLIYQSRSKRL